MVRYDYTWLIEQLLTSAGGLKKEDVWKMMLLKLIIEVFREKEIIIALHLHHAKKMREFILTFPVPHLGNNHIVQHV